MRAVVWSVWLGAMLGCGTGHSATPTASADAAAVDSGSDAGAALDVAAADAGSVDAYMATDATGTGDAGPETTADAGLADGQCTAEKPCTASGAYCKPAGSWDGCGQCKDVETGCKADSECQEVPNGICIYKKEDCTCSGTPLCHAGCGLDLDCGEGEVCAPDHRCKPKPCAAGGDCPALFVCAAAKACERQGCVASSECGGGAFCVEGKCFVAPGTCDFPKP